MGVTASRVDANNLHEFGLRDSYGVEIDAPDEADLRITDCFGIANTILPGAQPVIGDSPPRTEVASQWHPVHQFQLYVGTAGTWYKRRDINGFLLHYADSYGTYGPFGSRGPGRLSFYVLRANPSAETGW